MRIGRILVWVLAAAPLLAGAQYNLDGSKWSESGLIDFHFDSTLYSYDQYDYPVAKTCQDAEAYDEDGDPSTLGLLVDVAYYSGGELNFTVHLDGTLNPVTGVFTLENHTSGLSESFDYYVEGIGWLTFVLTDIDVVLAATLSGHNSCFINGSWRDPGATYVTDPVASVGVFHGYIDIIFYPQWTVTIDNIRATGLLCGCPGVWISGHLTLESYIPSPNGLRADIIVRDGETVETFPNTLLTGSDGAYQVMTHIGAGDVEVLAKVSHWLRGLHAGVNTLNGDVDGVDMSLKNGDADDNNSVDLTDLNAILIRFGQAGGMEDLNGSGTVDLPDLNVALINFGQTGAD
jgi:hypothetical protein